MINKMITSEKLNIYDKYSGDLDAFARVGTEKEKSIFNDDEWAFIDDLIQDIILLEKKLLSKEMEYKVKEKIKKHLIDENVKEELIQIIKRNTSPRI